jgi:hypothetical protein
MAKRKDQGAQAGRPPLTPGQAEFVKKVSAVLTMHGDLLGPTAQGAHIAWKDNAHGQLVIAIIVPRGARRGGDGEDAG